MDGFAKRAVSENWIVVIRCLGFSVQPDWFIVPPYKSPAQGAQELGHVGSRVFIGQADKY